MTCSIPEVKLYPVRDAPSAHSGLSQGDRFYVSLRCVDSATELWVDDPPPQPIRKVVRCGSPPYGVTPLFSWDLELGEKSKHLKRLHESPTQWNEADRGRGEYKDAPKAHSGVYVVRAKDSGNVKVGHSGDVDWRLKSLQTGSWEELEIVFVIRGSRETERQIHEDFDHLHIRGEWFKGRIVDALVSAIADGDYERA